MGACGREGGGGGGLGEGEEESEHARLMIALTDQKVSTVTSNEMTSPSVFPADMYLDVY